MTMDNENLIIDVPRSLIEFESMVRNRPASERTGFYRLTLMTYNPVPGQEYRENITGEISDSPSEPMVFRSVVYRDGMSFRLPVTDCHGYCDGPLYADYSTRQDAIDAINALVGKRNIFAFVIERLPFGQLTHRAFWTEAWMYDAQGRYVQTASCSAADYHKPGIHGKFFGHFPDDLPYRKGDVVVVLRRFHGEAGLYAVLGVIAEEPRDIASGYDYYRTLMRKRKRKGLSAEGWLDETDYPGSDDDEYFVQTGAYDELMQDFAFYHPMDVFPLRDTVSDGVMARLMQWHAKYLNSVEYEQNKVEQMTKKLSDE